MDDNELITKDELEKFKEIARKDYGVKLTDEQAFKQGKGGLGPLHASPPV